MHHLGSHLPVGTFLKCPAQIEYTHFDGLGSHFVVRVLGNGCSPEFGTPCCRSGQVRHGLWTVPKGAKHDKGVMRLRSAMHCTKDIKSGFNKPDVGYHSACWCGGYALVHSSWPKRSLMGGVWGG